MESCHQPLRGGSPSPYNILLNVLVKQRQILKVMLSSELKMEHRMNATFLEIDCHETLSPALPGLFIQTAKFAYFGMADGSVETREA